MTLRTLLSAALVSLSTASFAQTWQQDSIAMGVGYANDVYYKLSDGSTKFSQGNNWNLSFQMSVFGEPDFNASVRANHVRTGMEVFEINKAAPALFNGVTAADTVGKTSPSLALNNDESSWGRGAFYMNRNTADAYSYGWGEYAGNPSHAVNGISTYLLKIGGTAYKFWIKKYVSFVQTQTDTIGYTFQFAKLDGSTPVKTVTINRKDATWNFSDRLQAFYSIDSGRIENREPMRVNWDMLFTQHRDSVSMGPGGKVLYAVTGVQTNQGIEVAEVREVNPDPASYKSYPRTKVINEIGSNWKTYVNPGPNGYYQLDSLSNFFIRTPNYPNEFYQLKFTRFDGGGPSGQGKIVFAKRFIGSNLAVNNVASSVNSWYVVPNPAANEAAIMINAKTATPAAQLVVTDMAGRVVLNTPISVKPGMNGFNMNTASWPSGMYAVRIAGANLNMSTRLVVAH